MLHFGFVGEILGCTHNQNLVVFITVQNLIGIALVVLVIKKFEYFVRVA